jgi:hypothetical protein
MAMRLLIRAMVLTVVWSAFLLAQQVGDRVRAVGTVISTGSHQVTVKDDSGKTVSVDVRDSTRIVRAITGQKSLADAPNLRFDEIHPGDRMLASGVASNSGEAITATTIVVMTEADLAARRSQDQKAWQTGPRGVVTEIDAAQRNVTVKSATGTLTHFRVAPSAVILRYRDESTKFSDAQPARFDQIKSGDQLWTRGNQTSASEFVADGLVFGTFVNIAGRIRSVDPATNAVTVSDVFTKNPVTLRVTTESQMRQLPAPVAQRIAMQLQRGNASGPNGSPFPARPLDFQQVISNSPTISIAELHKGDAIIAVAGSETSHSPAFYLVDGVEPILTASPGGSSAAAFLASWNLSASGGEGE